MSGQSIEFCLCGEMPALASLIAALNKEGVPYTLKKDGFAVRITIGTGH